MKKIYHRLTSQLIFLTNLCVSFIRLKFIKNGDYQLPYKFIHRSLQPQCSKDFESDTQKFGPQLTQKWSKDGCGIASTVIAIQTLQQSSLPSTTEMCEKYRTQAYIAGIGWRHDELAAIARTYNLQAFNVPLENYRTLATRICRGWLPIVSVTLYFKGGEIVINNNTHHTKPKGGHLVVLTGFQVKKGKITGFYVMDCQNPTLEDGADTTQFVPITQFLSSYSGKAIYVCKTSY